MAQFIETPTKRQAIQNITYEQFLQDYTNIHAEWVNGEVIKLMGASNKHQELVLWLSAILVIFIQKFDLGWIRTAPFNMFLPDMRRGREPDIMFVTKARQHIVQPTNLSAAADLVIEIVSPESLERDTVQKLAEYEAGGVQEYWLIDPENQTAKFYHLAETGHYQEIMANEAGIFASKILPNFWLDSNWLWQEPLPQILDVVRELKLL
jgi:Uma2 family endonuclease